MDYELLIGIALGALVYIQTIRVDHYMKLYEITDASYNQLILHHENMIQSAAKNAQMFNERLPHLRAQVDEEMARLRKESEV